MLANVLIEEASKLARPLFFNTYSRNYSNRVGCALLAKSGEIYTGISIDLVCGLGNCAEYAAIAQMLKDRETIIKMIVAVHETKGIIPPCGRCRELITQIDERNANTIVIVRRDEFVSLNKLLPYEWIDA
jgi:cytidine deaminase